MYALDTNTLIYFFKGMREVAKMPLDTPPIEIGIPSIVVYELEVGIAKSTSSEKRTAQMADLLSFINVLPFELQEVRSAAQIRVAPEKQGQPIGPYDTSIAATVLTNQAVLIPNNVKEFREIEQLKCEDWFS